VLSSDSCFLLQLYLAELFFNFGSKYFQMIEIGNVTFSDSFLPTLTYYCGQKGHLFSHPSLCARTFLNFGSKYFQMIEIGNVNLSDCLLPTLTYYCAQ